MLNADEAFRQVMTWCHALPTAERSLEESLGAILAEDVLADQDLPPFDKALVDGCALSSVDAGNGLRDFNVSQTIRAGKFPTDELITGQTARIMTGAPLPQGADSVIMWEHVETVNNDLIRLPVERLIKAGQNVLARGREISQGQVVLPKSLRLNGAAIGMLGSVGRSRVKIVPQPRIRIVPTGDELVEIDQQPGPAQIRNSNAYVLRSLIEQAGGLPEVLPIAKDDPESLSESLSAGLYADILIVTGGVSAGEADLVPDTLASLGVEPVFHKIRLKPGKPLWFGVRHSAEELGQKPVRKVLVFGLPGNPVSVIVNFLLFVKPAIMALRGISTDPVAHRTVPLAEAVENRDERPSYIPARLARRHDRIAAEPVNWAGSNDLRGAALADGFILIPSGPCRLAAGSSVSFLPLLPS
jgi:molybdopterin molybdotransferase